MRRHKPPEQGEQESSDGREEGSKSRSLGDGVRWSVRSESQAWINHRAFISSLPSANRRQKQASVPVWSMWPQGMALGKGQVCQEVYIFKLYTQHWLLWLNGLSAGLRTKRFPVRFPVWAHAWVAGQVPSGGV